METNYIKHHGILGQKWGIRRFQNSDGTLTEEGRKRYLNSDGKLEPIRRAIEIASWRDYRGQVSEKRIDKIRNRTFENREMVDEVGDKLETARLKRNRYLHKYAEYHNKIAALYPNERIELFSSILPEWKNISTESLSNPDYKTKEAIDYYLSVNKEVQNELGIIKKDSDEALADLIRSVEKLTSKVFEKVGPTMIKQIGTGERIDATEGIVQDIITGHSEELNDIFYGINGSVIDI